MKSILGTLELVFYGILIGFVWRFLADHTWIDSVDQMEWYWQGLVLLVTFFGGEYLITLHDNYLWKKKVLKTAREIAEMHGIDPNTLDFEDFDVVEGEDGVMEVIIYKKKSGEEE